MQLMSHKRLHSSLFWLHALGWLFFSLYLGCVFSLLLFKTLPFIQSQQLSPSLTLLDPQLGEAINTKPFHSIRLFSQIMEPGGPQLHLALLNLLGNLLVFLPYGFLGNLLLGNKAIFGLFSSGIFCILLIEFLQLLTGIGVWDIDDILLNAAGLSLGILLASLLKAFWHSRHRRRRTRF